MPTVCVIFDIDGTLVDSTGFDDRLYITAIRDVLGDVSIRPDWGDYPHVTDTGILREICRENGLDAQDCEQEVRSRFGELVSSHLHETAACTATPGAMLFWDDLRHDERIAVGIATGGWGHTARMKLACVGYALAGIPLASSDDSHERVQIMQRCRAQLPPAQITVYVGDGEWDRDASERLGWRFIGIGKRLQGKCEHWIADFSASSVLPRLLG